MALDALHIHPTKQEAGDLRYEYISSSPCPFMPVGVIGLVNYSQLGLPEPKLHKCCQRNAYARPVIAQGGWRGFKGGSQRQG
jgi:hypothetical protein